MRSAGDAVASAGDQLLSRRDPSTREQPAVPGSLKALEHRGARDVLNTGDLIDI